MKGKDEIKDLFSEKLGNYEAPVRADMWANIASQVGSTASAASTVSSMSLLSKIGIVTGVVSIASVTAILLLKNPEEPTKKAENVTTTFVATEDTQNDTETETIVDETSELPVTYKVEKRETSTSPVEVEKPIKELDPNNLDEENFRKEVVTIKEASSETDLKENSTPPVAENEKEIKKVEVKSVEEPKTEEKEEVNSNTVTESPKALYELGELPNIFTPNNDGNNDYLFIESKGLVDFTFVVLNNKQEVIFETSDVNFKWDGMDKYGNKVEPGVYSYYFIAHDEKMNKVNKFVSLSIRY